MDKVNILCDKDRDLMYDFSRRCIRRVSGFSRFLLPVKVISSYLDTNVQKETEKDRLIIEHAAEALRSGKDLRAADVDDIFEITKAVDNKFVRKIALSPLSIRLRYDEIEPLRKKRILCLANSARDILSKWEAAETFENGIKRMYSKAGFKEMLIEILHLYNLETRMVNKCVKVLPPFDRGLSKFVETLFSTMEEVTVELVDASSKKIFGDMSDHAQA